MIASTVWNQLVYTLQQAPVLSYMKYVYEGLRSIEDENSLPCIMIEPTQNHESQKDMNQIKDVYLNLDLFAFSSANYNSFPKAIVGDQNYKGILDIENDIRAVLQSSYNLGNNVIDVRLDASQFDRIDMGKYPVRGMLIPLKILYRQINGV